jgi:hypothetical protein
VFECIATLGTSECRALVKDAIREGKNHLPPALVSYVELGSTKKCSKQLTPLMTDRESRPFVEASLTRIRKVTPSYSPYLSNTMTP